MPPGNQTRRQDRNGRVTQYSYDVYNRLTDEQWLEDADPVPAISISTTTEGDTYDEIQRVGFTGNFLAGTFTLTFSGQTTSALAYNASASTVQAALVALSNIASGDVSVAKLQDASGAQEWRITFGGTLGDANQPQITIDTTNITVMSGSVTEIEATDLQGSSTPADEVQVIDLDNATGGTFRLAFSGQTTAPLDYAATSSEVDAALEALSTIGAGDVSVSGSAGGPWTITFAGALADSNQPQLQGDAATASSGSVIHTIETEYNAVGEITAIGDSVSDLAYSYDGLGRILTVSNAGTSGVPTVVLTAAYNGMNSRTQLKASIASTLDFQNDYTYDNLQRQTQVAQVGQSGGNTVANKRLNYSYNAASFVTSIGREYKPSSTSTCSSASRASPSTIRRVCKTISSAGTPSTPVGG